MIFMKKADRWPLCGEFDICEIWRIRVLEMTA
jgi:hypothetical protein